MNFTPELIAIILFALIFISAFFLLLFFLIKQNNKISEIVNQTSPVGSTLLGFSRELGELKEASRNVEVLKENILKSFKEQDLRLKPIDEGMTHLISYFGSLKNNAGKVGELTFELLIEQMPEGKVLKNIDFQNGMRLEFMIEIAGEWVPVDSKFTKNPKVYFKKAVNDVSEKYVGQKVQSIGHNPTGLLVEDLKMANFGLIFFPSDEALFEVYKNEEFRYMMVQNRVWAVSPSNFYWQLFYFKWMEAQAERASDATEILNAMSLGLVEINKSVESIELVEKQVSQAMANLDKCKKSLLKTASSFKQK